MTASVWSMMVGVSRCSTRTSPGAWSTAPRMMMSLLATWFRFVEPPARLRSAVADSVAAQDLLGHGHRGHGFGPPGVEGQVRDRFDEFGLGGAVLLGQTEVVGELFGVPARGQRRYRDQAALLRRQLGALPDLSEQDIVGVAHECGCEVAEHLFGARGLLGVCVGRHGCGPFRYEIGDVLRGHRVDGCESQRGVSRSVALL